MRTQSRIPPLNKTYHVVWFTTINAHMPIKYTAANIHVCTQLIIYLTFQLLHMIVHVQIYK